jgi:hypothetical protein
MQNTNQFIRHRWANLEGRRVGHFIVSSIALANRDGSPNWTCECECGTFQLFSHNQLTQAIESGRPEQTLFCKNGPCKFARVEHTADQSLQDFRRIERTEQKRKEREAAEARDIAAKHIAKQQAEQATLEPFRADWQRYKLHQIKQGTAIESILNFSRWMQIGDSARLRLMHLVTHNGG